MQIKRLFENAISAVVIVVLLGGWIFGIVYGFSRFGVSDGLTALFAPPFAWFRAVSVIWTPPEWKEDWDLKAGNLAFVILYDDGSDPSVTYKFRQYEDDLQKWLKKVPFQNRKVLKTDAIALRNAYFAYGDQLMDMAIRTRGAVNLDSIFKSQAVQLYVNQFKQQKGFTDVWDKIMIQQNTGAVPQLKSAMEKLSDTDLDQFRVNWHDAVQASQKQFDARIESLFPQVTCPGSGRFPR